MDAHLYDASDGGVERQPEGPGGDDGTLAARSRRHQRQRRDRGGRRVTREVSRALQAKGGWHSVRDVRQSDNLTALISEIDEMRPFALTLNAFDKAYRENEEVVYGKGGQRRVNKAPTGAANTVVTIVASRNLSQRLTAVMEATFDAMKEKAIAPPQRLLAHRMVEEGAEGQEGCEISGRVELARVPVQLRVVAEAHHQTIAASWLNMSHLVRSLSFSAIPPTPKKPPPRRRPPRRRGPEADEGGEDPEDDDEPPPPDPEAARVAALHARVSNLDEGAHLHPLGGKAFHARALYAAYEHFIKVIPTTFALDSAGGELLLYQANNRINRRNGEAPSLHFSVDISPMRVEVREVHPSLTEFVTHLCAVLGGVFTTMGLIDGFFFYSTRALTKKTM